MKPSRHHGPAERPSTPAPPATGSRDAVRAVARDRRTPVPAGRRGAATGTRTTTTAAGPARAGALRGGAANRFRSGRDDDGAAHIETTGSENRVTGPPEVLRTPLPTVKAEAVDHLLA
ncbi:hypothetical protein [Streptomyces sp. AB3(2024)]|uniref:hypothetical protein n=1 Tax=Streptomyces sp. AB3(2024) TaxID=3317321 RepID=UPI0035A2B95B